MESETLISIVNRLILRGIDINLFIFRDDNNVRVWRPGGRKGPPPPPAEYLKKEALLAGKETSGSAAKCRLFPEAKSLL